MNFLKILYLEDSLPNLLYEKSPDFPVAKKMTTKNLTVPTHPRTNKKDLDKRIDIENNRTNI